MNAYIEVRAEVLYWEDAVIDGVEDSDGSLIPLRDGNVWAPVIRLGDGSVAGWPEGVRADIHYKVCDQGQYWLLDEHRNRVAKWRGDYVPDSILSQRETGHGDYIIMFVGADGKVDGWIEPAIEPSEWMPIDAARREK